MQLLGGAEAVPEDILRILKQVKFLGNKIDDFFFILIKSGRLLKKDKEFPFFCLPFGWSLYLYV